MDVSPATYNGKTRVVALNDSAIRQLRVGQLSSSPAVMRIVVEGRGVQKYDVAHQGRNKITLHVGAAQLASLNASAANVPVWRAAAKTATARPAAKAAARVRVVKTAPSMPQIAVKRPVKIAAASVPYFAAPAPAAPRNISLDVKNADILDVLKILAQQSGQNIIATQNVKGTATVSLHNVPLRQALDLVVRSSGLDYRRVGNVFVVGTPDDLAKQFGSTGQVAARTVAFPIKYADPKELAKQLGGMIPASSFTVDARTDTLLVSGGPDIIQSARNFLALADVAAPQVVFQVKVVDVTRNASSNVGVNFAGNSVLDFLENPVGAPPGTSFTVPATQYLGQPIAPQPFTRNELFISAQLNYLIQHNLAELLADPRVAALDNQQASLLVGQTYPLVYYDPKAGQFQAQYIDIGVKLTFTPVINSDGFITTNLHTERSVITGLVQQFPILSKRSADSVVRVKDGDTIVLGGMIDDQTITNLSKVPLLGDIPVFGALFRNVQKSKVHNEVVFLITPHIIRERL